MRIWLLRHGEAEPSISRDADRRLTERGRLQVRNIAGYLQGQQFTRVLCSPYIRARQTTDTLMEALGREHAPMIVPWLVPDEPVQTAIRELDRLPAGEVLLVSHQPLLGLLGGLLSDGSQAHPLPLGTGSLACLEGDFAAAGLMRLQALHHPQL